MSDSVETSDVAILRDVGLPPYDRRLTDKILAAYDHALALGYAEVAERLHIVLEIAEKEGVKKFGERRGVTVLDLAGLWRAFIAARDVYVRLASARPADPDKVADALSRMRERWRIWESFRDDAKRQAG